MRRQPYLVERHQVVRDLTQHRAVITLGLENAHAETGLRAERETEVLALIAKGRSNKEIASTLSVTEGTVKLHVTNILTKLEVNTRTEALVVAVQRGIIDIV